MKTNYIKSISIALFLLIVCQCGFSQNMFQIGDFTYSLYWTANASNPSTYDTSVCVYRYNNNTATSVEIPSTVTHNNRTYDVTWIGEFCFSGKSQLQQVTIPNSIKLIGFYAFEATGIQSINIPNSVQNIYFFAFADCHQLQTVYIGENVSVIESGTFWGCNSLTSVVFAPNSNLHHIDNQSFFKCVNLTNIVLPAELKTIDYKAFNECLALSEIIIPPKVTGIYDSAFFNCPALTKLTLSDSLQTIGAGAFNKTNIDTLTIPSNVSSIGKSAFINCSNLRMLNYNAKEIEFFPARPNHVFPSGQYIKLNIGEGVEVIPDYFFEQNEHLDTLILPSSLISVGNNAFIRCEELKFLQLNEGLVLIQDMSFKGCRNLDTIILPNSLIKIGLSAFEDCDNIVQVSMSDHLELINDNAFANCVNIESIQFPSTLTYIGNNAFLNCPLSGSVEIPEGVERIGKNAFKGCTNINTIKIGDGTKIIGESAFENCYALRKVFVGSGLEEVCNRAFAGNDSLALFFCMTFTPPAIGTSNVFPSPNNCNLIVPCDAKDSYSTGMWNWYFYPRIDEMNYLIEVSANDESFGRVEVLNDCSSNSAILSAIPNDGYLFERWEDGITDNPRQVELTKDTVFVAIFSTVGIDVVETTESIAVYPNPNKGLFSINLPQTSRDYQLLITDTQGRVIKTIFINKGESYIEVDLRDCDSGVYLLKSDAFNTKIIVE